MKELNFEELEDEENYTPFFQLKLDFEDRNDGKSLMKKFLGFVVQVQEMKVEIDTGSLNEILGLVTKIKTVLN